MNLTERSSKGLQVLIVEDETVVANMLRKGIEESHPDSVSTTVTGSLAGALTALGSGVFDLVILDLGLPDSEGSATLEQVRYAAPETPVVVLTGLNDPAVGTTCIEMGARNYLVKGNVGSAINRVIHHTLAARAALVQAQAAHKNLKNVLDSSIDAILVIEDGGEVKFANRMAKELFCGRVSEGHNIGVILDAGASLELDVPQSDGLFAKVEMRTGETLWFGKPARIVNFRDITKRAAAETALLAAEAALKEAQRTAKIGSWQYDVADDKLRWSREMFRIFDREPTIEESGSWSDHRSSIHPEDWERFDQAGQNAVKKGVAYRQEFRIVLGDGRIKWAEILGRPLRDESGRIVRLSGTVQDITDKYLAQTELKRLVSDQSAILDNISSYISFKDTENNLIQVSNSVSDLTGLPRHQIEGKHSREIFPEDADKYWQDDLEVIRSGMPKRNILQKLHVRGGNVGWCLTDKVPYVNDKGEVQGVIVIATDVSSLKQAEEALVLSEQKWRNILLNTPQLGISLDESGTIIFANKHFQKITGWKDEEIVGKDWFDTFIPENDQEKIREFFRRSINEGIAENFSQYKNEIATKSGKKIDVAWSNALSTDQHGTVIGVTCLGIDLTERIKAENELRKQQQLFETMFNTIPDGVVITDRERKIILANKGMEKTFGYHPPDILGKSTEILYADQRRFKDAGSTVFEHKAEKTNDLYVTRYKKTDGTEFPGETLGAKLLDAEGDWIGNLGIMRDITEREQTQQQLAEQLDELRRWQEVIMDRESRVIELKREVNELLTKAGQPPRFDSVLDAEPGTERTTPE